jgi:hypothetical protein
MPSFTEDTKYCLHCDKWLPQSLFAKDKNRIDGLNPWCKLCHRKARNKAGDTKSVRER